MSNHVVKNGKKQSKQQYFCKACHRQFVGKSRLDNADLWQEYTEGKQTYQQLAIKHNLSIKTIQRRLDAYRQSQRQSHLSKASTRTKQPAHLLIDTTYFGRSFGVMVFMDNTTNTVLYYRIIEHENYQLYYQGIAIIKQQGFIIKSITCDGKRGLLGGFGTIPTQMCQFHQIRIITRYLTTRPKHLASIELKQITATMPRINRQAFSQALDAWHTRHHDYYNERSIDENGKSHYTHRRLQAAYKSLIRNLPHLFIYQNDSTGNTANTTGKLEGLFSNLKTSLRCHQGLSLKRKLHFIDDFMKKHGYQNR